MATLGVMRMSAVTVGATVIMGALFTDAAQADLTLVTTRAALGADEVVNWEVLGQPYISIPNPISVISTPSTVPPDSVAVCGLVTFSCRVGVTVSKTSDPFELLIQGDGSSWSGDFPQGDDLLFTGRNFVGGPITLDFNVPVSGAGTQIQAAGGNRLVSSFSFLATIEAFDSLGNSLGSFTTTGLSTFGSINKSATYLGVVSDSANIAKVTINGEKAPGTGFAIDQLDLVTTGGNR